VKTGAGKDWRSILLAIISTGGAILAVAMAAIVVIFHAAMNLLGNQQKYSLIDAILLASAILFIGALLIPAAYFSFQRLIGEEVGAEETRPMSIPAGVLLAAVWLGVTALTQIFYGDNVLRWITPPFYILSISLPVYFFVRLTIGGLKTGSQQRMWGALGSGMIIGPSLAASAELIMVILLLIGAGIYMSFHPELRITLNMLKSQLNNASNADDILFVLGPYLLNPIVIVVALVFFSVLAPLVEETAKSLTAWTIIDHLSSPAEGFVIGALSGAGFGLVESLLASVQPDSSWAVTLFVRGGTTMMHIITTSLTGWGIGSFRVNKRINHMMGTYALAMFLHGLWNACVVMIVVGSMRTSISAQSNDIIGFAFIYFGATILIIVSLGVPVVLGNLNRRLRSKAHPASPTDIPEGKNIEGVK
jgi:RsiW-degrading membrane proteinase PrsW (M82 family)